MNGDGVDTDVNEAVLSNHLVADQGDAKAEFNLGLCCQYGKGVERDVKEAARLYSLAADQSRQIECTK